VIFHLERFLRMGDCCSMYVAGTFSMMCQACLTWCFATARIPKTSLPSEILLAGLLSLDSRFSSFHLSLKLFSSGLGSLDFSL